MCFNCCACSLAGSVFARERGGSDDSADQRGLRDACAPPARCASGSERSRASARRRCANSGCAGSIGLALAAAGARRPCSTPAGRWCAFFVFAALPVGTASPPRLPLMAAKEGLKHPVLEEVARKAGLEYLPADFTPPAFGGGLRAAVRRRRLLQPDLHRPVQRHGRGGPGLRRLRGLPSAPRRQEHLHRLLRPDLRDPAPARAARARSRSFRTARSSTSGSRRATWSGSGSRATRRSRRSSKSIRPIRWRRAQLLFDTAFRARLLELRKDGRVFVYAGPEEALVAASGKDRFEPGSMLRSRPGRGEGAADVRRRLRVAGAAQGAEGEAGVGFVAPPSGWDSGQGRSETPARISPPSPGCPNLRSA